MIGGAREHGSRRGGPRRGGSRRGGSRRGGSRRGGRRGGSRRGGSRRGGSRREGSQRGGNSSGSPPANETPLSKAGGGAAEVAWRAGTNARTRVRATDVENSRPPRDESWRSKNDPSGVASPASPPSKNNPARSGALRALSQHYCRDATFKALFYTIIEIVSVALRIAVAAGQGRNMSPTLRDDSDLSACLATLKNVTSTLPVPTLTSTRARLYPSYGSSPFGRWSHIP